MMRKAVQKPLGTARSVEGELRVGLAKSRTAMMVGGAVGDTANVMLKVEVANQTQQSNAAAAKYTSMMAAYQTQLEMDRFKIDEGSGKKIFEVMPDKVAEYDKQLKSQLRQEFDFSLRSAELNWTTKTSAEGAEFKSKANEFRNKEMINQSVALGEYALANTHDPDEAAKIIGDWAETGVINPDFAAPKFAEWMVDYNYDNLITKMPYASAESAQEISQSALSGTGPAANFSEQQRSQILKRAQLQIANVRREELRVVYNSEGAEVATKRLEELIDGGPEASGAIDETAHNTMVASLTASLGRQIKIDEAQMVEQGATNYFGIYSNPNATHEDITFISQSLDTKGTKAQLDEKVKPFAAMPPEQFYSSQDVDVLLVNGIRSGYVGKPLVTRLENDINNGILSAVDKVVQMETVAPRSIPINDRARKRLEFTQNRADLGMGTDNPVEEQKQFAEIEGRTTEQKSRDVKLAQVNLKEIESPEDAYTRTADELGYTDDDFFNPDAVQPGSAAEIAWVDAYTMILPYVNNNHERAARYATTAVSRVEGATTAYGENTPVTENNPPESVMPAPGFKSGQPNPYYDQQFADHIDQFNQDNGADYAINTVKREYAGKDKDGIDRWVYSDLNGMPLIGDNGKTKLYPYKREDPKIVEKSRTNSLNISANRLLNHQESVAAKVNFSLMEIADVTRDPVTGRIAETSTEATDINAERWSNITQNGRGYYNRMYNEAYSSLMGENMMLIEDKANLNGPELMLEVHLYLNSRGYMRGDKDGNFIRPSGGY